MAKRPAASAAWLWAGAVETRRCVPSARYAPIDPTITHATANTSTGFAILLFSASAIASLIFFPRLGSLGGFRNVCGPPAGPPTVIPPEGVPV